MEPGISHVSSASGSTRLGPGCRLSGAGGIARTLPELWIVLALAIIAASPRLFLQLDAPSFVYPDSPSYVEPAVDLLNGDGLTTRLKRPLGYPLLIATGLAINGQLDAVTALQHLIGVSTVALTYLLGRLCANRLVGFCAALAVALAGPQLTYEHSLLSEPLFTLLLVVLSLLLRHSALRGGWRSAAAVGLVLGITALVRPVGQLLLPFGILAALWAPGLRAGRSLATIAAMAAFFVVVTPWMLFNLTTHNRLSIGGAPGESLLARTLSYSRGQFVFDSPELPAPADAAEAVARATLQGAVKSGATPGQTRDRLRSQLDLSEEQTDRLLQRITIEAVRRQPLEFILGTPELIVRLYQLDERGVAALWDSLGSWDKRPALSHLARLPTFDQQLSKGAVDALLDAVQPLRFGLTLPILGLLSAVTVWHAPDRRAILLLTGLYSWLVLTQVTLDGPVSRYRYAAEPLLNVLVGVSIWQVLRGIATRIEQRGAGSPWVALAGRLPAWSPLAVLFFLGLLTRCWGLARFDPSAFGNEYDEGIRLAQLDLMAAGFRPFHQIYASQGPLLLDYFAPFYRAFGPSVLAARLPVTLASLACLAGVYLSGRALAGELAGLIALALLAITPSMIETSRLALAEVPSLGPVCLAVWLVCRPGRARRSLLVVVSGVLFGLGLLMKPMAVSAAVPALMALVPNWRQPVASAQLTWLAAVAATGSLVLLALGPSVLWEQFVTYRQGAVGLGALGHSSWGLDTNWLQIQRQLSSDVAPIALTLATLPAALMVNPRLTAIAGAWFGATLVMLMLYSPLAEKHVTYLLPPLALLGGSGLSATVTLLRRRPSEREPALIGLAGLACAFTLLSVGVIVQDIWHLTRPNIGTLAAGSDFRDAQLLIARYSGASDFIVTDHPYLAAVARRLLPPRLVDPSRTRILSGALTDREAIEQTQSSGAGVIVYWSGRLPLLKEFSSWVEREYSMVRTYEENRAIFVRQDLLPSPAPTSGGARQAELVDFGDVVGLGGFELTAGEGADRRLTLTFTALRPVSPETYLVQTEVRDRDGVNRTSRRDRLLPRWRATSWQPGQPLQLRRTLSLRGLEPGRYNLVLSVMVARDGQRLPVTIVGKPATESAGEFVDLGSLTIQ